MDLNMGQIFSECFKITVCLGYEDRSLESLLLSPRPTGRGQYQMVTCTPKSCVATKHRCGWLGNTHMQWGPSRPGQQYQIGPGFVGGRQDEIPCTLWLAQANANTNNFLLQKWFIHWNILLSPLYSDVF